jgi:hypothetical protein
MEDLLVELGKYLVVIVPIIMTVLGFIWIVLPDKKKYGIQLCLGLTGPKYSLALSSCKKGIPANLSGKFQKHIRFLHVRLLNTGEAPKYNVTLEICEPTNRWTFRNTVGVIALSGWNEVKGPTADNPRCVHYDLLEKGHGVIIGAVGINNEKEDSEDEFMTWRFTCLGRTVGKGRTLVT